MKKQILLGVMLLCSLSLFAQYLTIREIDESGNIRALNGSHQTIDLNSHLNIDINKAFLTDKMADRDTQVNALINKLIIYQGLIEKMQLNIIQYEKAFKIPDKNFENQNSATKKISEIANEILQIFLANPQYEEKLEKALQLNTDSNEEGFGILLSTLADEMKNEEKQLYELVKSKGFYFQLAAWSITERGIMPLHLAGFDDLPPGEFYKYERNHLYLSSEQLEELNQLVAFFENVDKSNVFEKLSGLLLSHLSKAVDIENITTQIEEVQKQLNNLITTSVSQKEVIVERLNSLREKWKGLEQNLKILKEKYSASGGIQSASSKIDVLYGFEKDVQNLQKQLEDISNLAKTIISPDDIKKLGAAAAHVVNDLETLGKTFSETGENLVNYSREAYQMAAFGRQMNTAALEVSEKVYKLSLDKTPVSTILDLLYTNKREQGDVIMIKAMLWHGENQAPVETENYSFTMMNALAHVHMTVAYAFAKPVPSFEKNFKGGPLVSVLYKFKSHNLAYRNFLDIGFGLHTASYDFNNDDTPEFAGGIVASIFKDYLQMGWGFNFNEKQGYWFAGLRIPIPKDPISLH